MGPDPLNRPRHRRPLRVEVNFLTGSQCANLSGNAQAITSVEIPAIRNQAETAASSVGMAFDPIS